MYNTDTHNKNCLQMSLAYNIDPYRPGRQYPNNKVT